MRFAALLLAAATVALPLQRIVRESNSAAEMKHGAEAYRKGDYDRAARLFAHADALRPSSRAAFDGATAKLAQKDVQGAAPLLLRALKDPTLRAATLYNRGTGELNAKQYDQAISDLTSVLRLDPQNRGAKQNLEMALQQRQQQQQSKQKEQSSGGSNNQQQKQQASGGQNQQQQQTPQGQQQSASKQQQGQPTDPAEALLRSVQEQENEELRRLRAAREERREVGW